ncbi:MAG: hypothetical protein JSW55_02485 [Chloroflexota bacterium]|nr:MAG: hypothetical protein JSW55_02485 [Chloroflexota bacterium]
MEQVASRVADNQLLTWLLFGAITLAAAALLLLAPAEATIGEGIRIVYIHVALIWTGMLVLIVAGLLGLVVLLTGRALLTEWMQVVAWVGLAFFAAGVVASLAAEIVNWGGIAWREPRTAANLNLLALTIIVQVVNTWLPDSWGTRRRLQGALNAFLAAAVIWTTMTTEVQLHPANAVGDATSQAIQLTFYGLSLLSLSAAIWSILYLRGRQTAHQSRRHASDRPGSVGSDRSGRSSKAGS